MEYHWDDDFKDNLTLVKQLNELIDIISKDYSKLGKMLGSCLKKRKIPSSSRDQITGSKKRDSYRISNGLPISLNILDSHPLIIGNSLMVICYKLYKRIKPRAFYSG